MANFETIAHYIVSLYGVLTFCSILTLGAIAFNFAFSIRIGPIIRNLKEALTWYLGDDHMVSVILPDISKCQVFSIYLRLFMPEKAWHISNKTVKFIYPNKLISIKSAETAILVHFL